MLQSEYTDGTYFVYLYDETGKPYGYAIENWGILATCYYVYNQQGDIIAIRDEYGELLAEYSYGSYGETVMTPLVDTSFFALYLKNPLRYRGYYYDAETGFYFCNSRYYDPEICRWINADGYISTGAGLLGCNMFSYCNNNPVTLSDSSGTRPILSSSTSSETAAERKAACEYMKKLATRNKTTTLPLTNDQKVLIATIAAEATVTATGDPVSSAGRQAMANVAINRVQSREWAKYNSVAEICQFTGFDGYGDDNYQACMNYLDNRDGSNLTYEMIIWDVMAAYEYDITNGCQLYYTPAAMQPAGSVPNWNFNVLTEVYIPGVDSYYEGRFFKY